ncbi:Cytochrome c biogenesis ATP-binding export protein CcmA [Sphingomonas antarctica]|uniref:heme ABC exporter ATP-binding protein CcmA n=1 Tax=Sphingomonas antarctica TaxID=2040274 RepID=UPI0039ED7E9C
MTHLVFDAVTGERGGRTLFEGVSFALAAGDALRVSGANGAGKSSLLRIAAGLLASAGGTVGVEGRVAITDERLALDRERPLVKAIAFWAGIDGGDVAFALAGTGLTDLAEVPVRLLSTGQRKRAALARVEVAGALIWLLDEPANGLDTAGVAMLEALIARHRARGGIAVVATHQPVALPDAQELVL